MPQNIPDVRVRLSAEGVDEVVRAFQQVSAAAKKSGTESAAGFGALKSALNELKGMLPAIGFAGAVIGMGEMIKNALESADAIGKLSEKTGLSTETLSTLSFAANMVGVDFEQLSKGLIKFNKTQGDLEGGGKKAAHAVDLLFGSASALNGLNTDQRFAKVAEAIGKLPAGFQKTTAAMNFFGKSGAELIPLFNEIGTQGFDVIEKKAASLGLVIDEKTAKAAERAVESFKLLKAEAQGAALQFTSGLAPAIADAMTSVSNSLASGGENGLKKFGDGVGAVIKGITLAFLTIGSVVGGVAAVASEAFSDLYDQVKTIFAEMIISAKATGTAIKDVLTADLSGAKGALAAGQQAINTLDADLAKRSKERTARARAEASATVDGIKASYNALFNAPATAAGKDGAPTGNDDPAKKSMINTAKALLALQLQEFQNRLALDKQYAALFAAEDQQRYQEGLISLKDYFDGRTKAIDAGANAEIAELEKERKLLINSPLDLQEGASDDKVQAAKIARRKAVEAVDAKIASAQAGRLSQQDANDYARFQAELAVSQKELDIQAQLKTAQGDIYDAAIDAIKRQATELAKLHISPELIEQFKEMSTAKAAIAEMTREGQNAFAALGNAQAALTNQASAGQLFPFQAVQKYDAAVQQALPGLRALAAARRAAAVTPEERNAAEQFANQVDAIGIAADESAVRMGQFKAAVESSLTSNLSNFFSSGITQATGFGDAMRLMALSVVDSLRQIAAQMLATLIVQKALSAAGGFFGLSGGGLVGDNSAVMAAEGGPVVGPGTGTSDSIPARLSHGEFVVRASSVAQPGVLPLLAAINRGMGSPSLRSRGVPHFADGGVVSASSAMSGADQQAVHLHVGLEEGVILRHAESFMRSKTGQRIQVENLNKNQKAVTQALGK